MPNVWWKQIPGQARSDTGRFFKQRVWWLLVTAGLSAVFAAVLGQWLHGVLLGLATAGCVAVALIVAVAGRNLVTANAALIRGKDQTISSLETELATLNARILTAQNQQAARALVRREASEIRSDVIGEWNRELAGERTGMGGSAGVDAWADQLRDRLYNVSRLCHELGFDGIATHVSQQGDTFDPTDPEDAISRARQIARNLDIYATSGEIDPPEGLL